MVTPTMRQKYPHTPEQILAYDSNKLRETFDYQGEEKVRLAINELFRIVSEVTHVPSEALPERLGFQAKNPDRDSFQALLAVMRTIVMLHHLGFVEITPLPPKRKRKEADLSAMRQDVKFAVEVLRTNEDQPRHPSLELGEYIAKNYRSDTKPEDSKMRQLDATMHHHSCSKAIFVVVFDSYSNSQFSQNELEEAAGYAFGAMGFPDNTHLLIFTGILDDVTGENGLAIFPELLP